MTNTAKIEVFLLHDALLNNVIKLDDHFPEGIYAFDMSKTVVQGQREGLSLLWRKGFRDKRRYFWWGLVFVSLVSIKQMNTGRVGIGEPLYIGKDDQDLIDSQVVSGLPVPIKLDGQLFRPSVIAQHIFVLLEGVVTLAQQISLVQIVYFEVQKPKG